MRQDYLRYVAEAEAEGAQGAQAVGAQGAKMVLHPGLAQLAPHEVRDSFAVFGTEEEEEAEAERAAQPSPELSSSAAFWGDSWRPLWHGRGDGLAEVTLTNPNQT